MFDKDYFESDGWQEYIRLMAERPQAFTAGFCYPIITDKDRVLDFMNRTGRPVGVIYKSDYSYLVVDLVDNGKGSCFAYERTMPAVASGAVVMLTHYHDKYILLRQFRHAIRREQLACPRGFGEIGLSSEENAAKELSEELGASVISSRVIGTVYPDSGITATKADIVECRIESYESLKGTEGIIEVLELSEEEINKLISEGEITDGYTLAAWAMK